MTSPWPDPDPNPLPTGPTVADPTGLRYDRGDLEEPAATRTAGDGFAITGRDPIVVADLGCGHLPGERHDGSCDYWRGVALGEYPAPDGLPGPYGLPGYRAPVASRPPFNLRRLAEQHLTAAELDRRERGAA